MGGVRNGGESGTGDEVRPPAWAALVVALLVATMVVAFVVPVRFGLWPATSWELFSRARSAEQVGYRVDLVAHDGAVAPLPFSRLGPGHHRWRRIAVRFPAWTPEQRTRACESWAEAAQQVLGPPAVAEVRVYQVVWGAADRAADPPRAVSDELVVRCGPP